MTSYTKKDLDKTARQELANCRKKVTSAASSLGKDYGFRLANPAWHIIIDGSNVAQVVQIQSSDGFIRQVNVAI